MKNIILFLFAAALLAASSCKKNYTCVCENYVTGTDTSYTFQAIDEHQAVNQCDAQILGHTANCAFDSE